MKLTGPIRPLTVQQHPVLRTKQPHFGDQAEPLGPKAPPTPKLGWLSRSMAGAVSYCYTHPKAMLRLQNLLYPPFLRQNRGSLPDRYLNLFEPLEAVNFPSLDRLMLQGQFLPAASPSKRTIIMGHGYFGNWKTMLGVAHPLRQAGYNILLFNFRAHGNSEGPRTSFGYNEGKDIAGAVRFITSRFPRESESLFYVGHSMGAASFLMLPQSLSKYPKELALVNRHLKAVVLDSPYSNFEEVSRRFVQQMDSLDVGSPLLKRLARMISRPLRAFFPKLMLNMRQRKTTETGLEVGLHELEPAKLYVKSQPPARPLLVIHGTEDRVIHPEHGRQVHRTLVQYDPTVQLKLLEGIDHLNRRWDPGDDGGSYNSAWRGEGIPNAIRQFLDPIRFGFSGDTTRPPRPQSAK